MTGQVQFLRGRRKAKARLSGFGRVILSSLPKGAPVTTSEAMAAKRPVVATQVGAVPDVIEDGRTGVLVPPRDPHRLAQVVIGLLRDPGRQRALYSQDYVSRLVTDMRELYLRLVRQRGIVFKPEEP